MNKFPFILPFCFSAYEPEGTSQPESQDQNLPVPPLPQLTEPLDNGLQGFLQRIEGHFAQVESHLGTLSADFETKIRYDKSQAQVISTLHQELQNYRDDFVLKLLRPLATDLISLYDDFSQSVSDEQRAAASENATLTQLIKNVELIPIDIEEMLQRNGFESYAVPDDQFDNTLQRITQTIPTETAAQDRRVATHLRKGFRYGERVIRPELVTVYRYQPVT